MLGIAQWMFEWGCIFGFGYGTYLLIFSSISTTQGGDDGLCILLAVPVIVGVMVVTAGVVGVARAVVGGWREWRSVVGQRRDEEEGGEIVLRTPRVGRVERRGGWWGDICEPGEPEDEEGGYTSESGELMGVRGSGWRSSRAWDGGLERIDEEEGERVGDEKVGLLSRERVNHC